MNHSDKEIETMILAICLERGAGKTICPSEAARALEQDGEAWRALMPRIREVAQRLSISGQIAILRKGEITADHNTGGLVRLGLPKDG